MFLKISKKFEKNLVLSAEVLKNIKAGKEPKEHVLTRSNFIFMGVGVSRIETRVGMNFSFRLF